LLRLKLLPAGSATEPKNAIAWDRLGVALQARGLFNNETENAYRRAVELDPQFPVAYAHLARAHRMDVATRPNPCMNGPRS